MVSSLCVFFFSSRRRHTRLVSDWSSDVCSSDLPLAGSQPSAVQLLPSLQSGGGPPTQLPPAQVSAVVQALPSSQAAVLFVCTQPRTGSQESSVHGLPSSQGGFGTFMQPTPGWHESAVQT